MQLHLQCVFDRACNIAELAATVSHVSHMQTQSQNGSSFNPNDAASDVASSVNGHNGGMHAPPTFNQPQFGQSFGMHPFGQSSPDGWGRGHNVQAQVCFSYLLDGWNIMLIALHIESFFDVVACLDLQVDATKRLILYIS